MFDFLVVSGQIGWTYFWLAVAVVALVFEIITVGLTSIWMTGGALAALLISALGGPVWLQIVVFFVVTFVLVYFTRPWAMKYLNKRRSATNFETVIGKPVRVIERVDNIAETGRALYNGMEWTARSANSDVVFEKDETATVLRVEGVKMILTKQEENPVGTLSEPEVC